MQLLYRKKNYTQGHLRQLIVTKVKEENKDYRTVQNEINVSLRTISKWSNSETLESKSSAPLNPNRTYEFEQLIKLFIVRKYLKLSIDDCIDELIEKYNVIIKRGSIQYYFKQRGLNKIEKEKIPNGKFKEYDPGFEHIDVTYLPKIDGKKYYLFVVIDRATRISYYEVYENKTAENVAKFLENVINFLPFKIIKILTDNGKEFTLHNHKGKFNLEGLFDQVCNEYEIEHRLTKVYTPKTNGMVEKCNDTIKVNTIKKDIYQSIKEMKNELLLFMIFYNLFRRHGGIVKENKGRTPYDALCYYYKLMPELFKDPPEIFREKLFEIAKQKKLTIYTKRKM